MVPYVLPQFVVGLVLLFPHAILHEAAITFLGFGLPPEMPAIGIILSEAMGYLSAGLWWLAVFPGLALVVCVMLFDVVGTSLRKLVEPGLLPRNRRGVWKRSLPSPTRPSITVLSRCIITTPMRPRRATGTAITC